MTRSFMLQFGSEKVEVSLETDGEIATLKFGGKSYPVRLRRSADHTDVDFGGKRFHVHVRSVSPGVYDAETFGEVHRFNVQPAAEPEVTRAGGKRRAVAIEAPMAGRIVQVAVKQGDEVARGATLCILQAMKMDNRIEAPCDGKIVRLKVAPNSAVNQGQVLALIAPARNGQTASRQGQQTA